MYDDGWRKKKNDGKTKIIGIISNMEGDITKLFIIVRLINDKFGVGEGVRVCQHQLGTLVYVRFV